MKKKHAKSSYILANSPQRNSIQNQIKTFWMKKKQAKSSYILANSPQRNSIQNQTQTFWIEKAGQKFVYLRKLPSTKFYLESNWKFLNEKGRPEIPISPQTLSNEIRFRIKLKLSEWENTPKVHIP